MSLSRLAGATALALLPVSATAQVAQTGPSLWDLLKPEYLVMRVLQSGIMAARTQVDIKYGAMTVDLRLGQITLTDVAIWPLVPWDEDGACEVAIDRLTLRTAPFDRPDLVRFKVQAQGVDAGDICLPPEPRQMLALAGLDRIAVPRLTVDLEYDIAKASADVHAYTQVSDFAALDLTADFSYLWMNGRKDMENPEPVAWLGSAALSVENLGGFERLKGLIPPPFTDPVQAPAILEGMVGGAIAGMNRDAAPADAPGDPSALNEAQLAFVAALKSAWPGFLENPGTLVIETGFPAGDDVFVDFAAYESDPAQAFSDLQPRVSLAPARARAALPAALVSAALGDGAATMAHGDLLRVGLALVTGDGAPRNIAAGAGILTGLAEAGDGEAALALSQALETRDPETAYRWALSAGADSQTGAAARLDRLERVLPFEQVLAIQAEALGDVQHPLEALQRVALMRAEAMGRLSGVGRQRSYSVAALWAMMGAAAGDAESADILAQIDERVRLAGPDAQAAWAETETAASDLAMQAWLGQDLPARFGAQ